MARAPQAEDEAFLTLTRDPMQEALWGKDLHVIAMAQPGADQDEAARDLDVFLDSVAMRAAAGSRPINWTSVTKNSQRRRSSHR